MKSTKSPLSIAATCSGNSSNPSAAAIEVKIPEPELAKHRASDTPSTEDATVAGRHSTRPFPLLNGSAVRTR